MLPQPCCAPDTPPLGWPYGGNRPAAVQRPGPGVSGEGRSLRFSSGASVPKERTPPRFAAFRKRGTEAAKGLGPRQILSRENPPNPRGSCRGLAALEKRRHSFGSTKLGPASRSPASRSRRFPTMSISCKSSGVPVAQANAHSRFPAGLGHTQGPAGRPGPRQILSRGSPRNHVDRAGALLHPENAAMAKAVQSHTRPAGRCPASRSWRFPKRLLREVGCLGGTLVGVGQHAPPRKFNHVAGRCVAPALRPDPDLQAAAGRTL